MPEVGLKGRKFTVPSKCIKKMQGAVKKFNGPKTTEGYERAINIIKNPVISLELLKKINNFFRTVEKNTWPYHQTAGS